MIPPTIPNLIARAADHPFLGEHLAMGTGVHSAIALAQFDGIELASSYEPIFDISVHALAQSLSSGAEGVDRFGDELGFQAVTQRLDGAPFDIFDPFERIADDQKLVALDRMSRALHAINFSATGCCFCACTSGCSRASSTTTDGISRPCWCRSD
jgi:hypothetical protein